MLDKAVLIHDQLIALKLAVCKSEEERESSRKTLEQITIKREKMIEEASRIDSRKFDKYEPLVEDLRLDKRSALLQSFLINVKRLVILYMAMFVIGK